MDARMRWLLAVVLVLAMLPTAFAEINTGLAAWYDANESTGNLTDIVFWTYNVTEQVPSPGVQGLIEGGRSLTAAGFERFVGEIPPVAFGTNQSFTITEWVNFTGRTGGDMKFAGAVVPGGQPGSLIATMGTTPTGATDDMAQLYLSIHSGADQSCDSNGELNLSENVWYLMAITYDDVSRNATLYVNTVQACSVLMDLSENTTAATKFVVGSEGGGQNPGNITVDEIGVWNRALNVTELNFLYNGGAGAYYNGSVIVQAGGGGPGNTPVQNLSEALMAITFDTADFNGTAHLDQSGNGKHLALYDDTGDAVTTGIVGAVNEADYINGMTTTDPTAYVPLSGTLLPQAWSFCVMVWDDDLGDNEILGSDYLGTTGGGFDIYESGGQVQLFFYDGSGDATITYPTVLTTNFTHICVAVRDDGNFTVWANGTQVSATTETLNGWDPVAMNYSDGQSIYVGDYYISTGVLWSGGYDELLLYEGVLSDAQVQDIYNNLTEGTQYPFTGEVPIGNASASIELLSPANASFVYEMDPVTFIANLTQQNGTNTSWSCDLYFEVLGIPGSPGSVAVVANGTFNVSDVNVSLYVGEDWVWYYNCTNTYHGKEVQSGIFVLEVLDGAPVDTGGFTGATTNFSGQNTTAIDQPVLEDPGNMKIAWDGSDLNFSGANLSAYVTYGDNWINVESASLPSGINTSANVTLYGVYNDLVQVLAEGTVCQTCAIITNNGSQVEFTVPHFTNYSLQNGTLNVSFVAVSPTLRIVEEITNGSPIENIGWEIQAPRYACQGFVVFAPGYLTYAIDDVQVTLGRNAWNGSWLAAWIEGGSNTSVPNGTVFGGIANRSVDYTQIPGGPDNAYTVKVPYTGSWPVLAVGQHYYVCFMGEQASGALYASVKTDDYGYGSSVRENAGNPEVRTEYDLRNISFDARLPVEGLAGTQWFAAELVQNNGGNGTWNCSFQVNGSSINTTVVNANTTLNISYALGTYRQKTWQYVCTNVYYDVTVGSEECYLVNYSAELLNATCADTIPNELDQPGQAQVPLNATVYAPLGFGGAVGNVTLTLGATQVNSSNCTLVTANATTGTFVCYTPLHYWYAAGNYTANGSFVTSPNRTVDLDVAGFCAYAELVASQRTTAVVSFPTASPGVQNASGNTPVNMKNTGNAALRLYLTGYDLTGRTTPSVKLPATVFRAGHNLSASVQMQNATQKNLSMIVSPAQGAEGNVSLWVSMPAAQPLQEYYAATPWVLTATS